MPSVAHNIRCSFLVLGVGMLLFMNLFGIFHLGMSMSMDGKMSDCPFMLGMSVCPMSPLEHISFMHSFFSNIPAQGNPTLALLLALTFIVAVGIAWFQRLFSPPDLYLRRSLYSYRKRSLSISRFLQELFSSGILNPKPF